MTNYNELIFAVDNKSGMVTIMNSNKEKILELGLYSLVRVSNKLKEIITDMNEQKSDIDFYKDELHGVELSVDDWVKIYNDLSDPKKHYIKATDEFIEQWSGYKVKPLSEVVQKLTVACYDVESVNDLFECEYYSIEDDWGEEYLCPWYKDDALKDNAIGGIASVISKYTKEDLDSFNKKYNLDIRFYGDYEKEMKEKIYAIERA
jgi:hypothetical protein